MEICGSHTAAIAKNGIPSLLSPQIRLLSGPGCPVCVAPVSFIENLKHLALQPGCTVAGFGDILRTPGKEGSLLDARSKGAKLKMIYSPMDLLALAQEEPARLFVLAAVGFETTAPVYAQLLDELREREIKNVRILTALKTMPEVIRWLLQDPECEIDGMLCPGHVCVITGEAPFEALAAESGIPFVIAGFSGEELLVALYDLLRNRGRGILKNDYPSVVKKEGNPMARALVEKYFEPSDAEWRGLGVIPGSGLRLREEYALYSAETLLAGDGDAGDAASEEGQTGPKRSDPSRAESRGADQVGADPKQSNPPRAENCVENHGCRCPEILTGKKQPADCPLFRKICTPSSPHGACMTSGEGSCFTAYRYGR